MGRSGSVFCITAFYFVGGIALEFRTNKVYFVIIEAKYSLKNSLSLASKKIKNIPNIIAGKRRGELAKNGVDNYDL